MAQQKQHGGGPKGKFHSHVFPHFEQIVEWKTDGLTETQIAKNLGLTHTTFWKYKQEYPELVDVLKKGDIGKVETIAGAQFRAANGTLELTETKVSIDADGKKRVEKITRQVYNATAAIFLMKNLAPELFRDRQILEHTGKDGGPIETNTNARDAFTSRITRLAERQTAESLN